MYFGGASEKLLGFIMINMGIEIDLAKIRSIEEMLPPRTKREVRSFWGN